MRQVARDDEVWGSQWHQLDRIRITQTIFTSLQTDNPTPYIIIKNDLCSISAINDIFKYADDTTLLVPQHTDVELDVEFQNVKAWAATNCLKLNLSKTKEIVFKRPRVQYFHTPLPLVDIEELDCCKLLCAIFQSNFRMDSRIQFILPQCA